MCKLDTVRKIPKVLVSVMKSSDRGYCGQQVTTSFKKKVIKASIFNSPKCEDNVDRRHNIKIMPTKDIT